MAEEQTTKDTKVEEEERKEEGIHPATTAVDEKQETTTEDKDETLKPQGGIDDVGEDASPGSSDPAVHDETTGKPTQGDGEKSKKGGARLTVLLLRCGETEVEAHAESMEVYDEAVKQAEEQGNEELKPEKPKRLTTMQKTDPALTSTGFQQAQFAFTPLIKALSKAVPEGEQRNMAYFMAPLRSCAATTLMMSVAQLPRYENLRWRLSTVNALQAPSSVPVIVVNGLATSEPEIDRLGGDVPTVKAGLLHCAAEEWNDARTKCPLMLVCKEMKEACRDRIEKWKEDAIPGEKPRRVIGLQWHRISDKENPWSLVPITQKVNVLINYVEPTKYMTPPRSGGFESKGQKSKEKKLTSSDYLRQAVWWARQVGCDTVLVSVGPKTIIKMAEEAGWKEENMETPPCSLASFIADVPGDGPDDIQFELHSFLTADDLKTGATEAVPEFTGPVDVLVQPPEGQDPSTVPVNQWSKFPAPEPENIPPNYPKLPPFSRALDVPMSQVKAILSAKDRELGGDVGPGSFNESVDTGNANDRKEDGESDD